MDATVAYHFIFIQGVGSLKAMANLSSPTSHLPYCDDSTQVIWKITLKELR